MEHPIILPPHVEIKLIDEAPRFRDGGAARERWLIQRAAQLGADQELEACCGWIESKSELGASFFTPEVRTKFRCQVSDQLRAARRPKPPSLKQQASDSLDEVVECLKMLVPGASVDGVHIETIRRALESLPDPQD